MVVESRGVPSLWMCAGKDRWAISFLPVPPLSRSELSRETWPLLLFGLWQDVNHYCLVTDVHVLSEVPLNTYTVTVVFVCLFVFSSLGLVVSLCDWLSKPWSLLHGRWQSRCLPRRPAGGRAGICQGDPQRNSGHRSHSTHDAEKSHILKLKKCCILLCSKIWLVKDLIAESIALTQLLHCPVSSLRTSGLIVTMKELWQVENTLKVFFIFFLWI